MCPVSLALEMLFRSNIFKSPYATLSSQAFSDLLSASWDMLPFLFHALTIFKTLLPTRCCFKFIPTQLLNQMLPSLSCSISSATVPTLFPPATAFSFCHSCSYSQGAVPLNFAREKNVQPLGLLRHPPHYFF